MCSATALSKSTATSNYGFEISLQWVINPFCIRTNDDLELVTTDDSVSAHLLDKGQSVTAETTETLIATDEA